MAKYKATIPFTDASLGISPKKGEIVDSGSDVSVQAKYAALVEAGHLVAADATVTENGTYNVRSLAEVTVDVPSGAALPEVTSDDNGKVLTVVEGEWAKAAAPEAPSEVYRVNYTFDDQSDAWVCDKSFSEIMSAITQGKTIIAVQSGNIYFSLAKKTDTVIEFSSVKPRWNSDAGIYTAYDVGVIRHDDTDGIITIDNIGD